MAAAILKNLKVKTGRDLHGWIDVLRDDDLTDPKQAVTHLKQTYGLGHFQAKTVVDRMNDVDHYANSANFVNELFVQAGQHELCDFAREQLLTLSGVREQPCRTYIPFYRKQQFALLAPAKAGILLGLALAKDDLPAAAQANPKIGSARINAAFHLSGAADWNETVAAAVKRAWSANG